MTILCVRFQLPPMYEAALPGLLGTLEEFTPVVEALPPDGALADLRGAERYFRRDVVELASLIRVRALAWHGYQRCGRPPRVRSVVAGRVGRLPVTASPEHVQALLAGEVDGVGIRVAARPWRVDGYGFGRPPARDVVRAFRDPFIQCVATVC